MPDETNKDYVANTALEAALTKVREKIEQNIVVGGPGSSDGTGEPSSTMTAAQAIEIIDRAFEDFETENRITTDMIADGAVTADKLADDARIKIARKTVTTEVGQTLNVGSGVETVVETDIDKEKIIGIISYRTNNAKAIISSIEFNKYSYPGLLGVGIQNIGDIALDGITATVIFSYLDD